MSRTPDQIVNAEVHYCVSYLVSTLANTVVERVTGTAWHDAVEMCEQALNLAGPVDDWEEALIQHDEADGNALLRDENGWYCSGRAYATPQEACEDNDIEPYQREVFEHWIVSDWLAGQLEARGEKVDKDFAGMIVWARTTSGQGIASDSVIEAIAADLNKAG